MPAESRPAYVPIDELQAAPSPSRPTPARTSAPPRPACLGPGGGSRDRGSTRSSHRFKYQSRLTNRKIRLIRLWPGNGEQRICFSLSEADLDDSETTFMYDGRIGAG